MSNVLEKIKKAAEKGSDTIKILLGERSEFFDQVTVFVTTNLQKKGYKVEVDRYIVRPFGSDPGRWDVYTEINLDISWKDDE